MVRLALQADREGLETRVGRGHRSVAQLSFDVAAPAVHPARVVERANVAITHGRADPRSPTCRGDPRARSRVRRRGCWCVRERVCGGHTALRWEFAAAGWANAVLVWVWVHTEGCTAAPRCTSPAGAQWPWRRCADGRHALTTGCSRDGGVRHRQGANGEVVPSQPPRQLPACLHNRWYQRGCDDGHFYVGYVCDARVPLSFHAAAWYLTCVLHAHRHSHCRRSEWPPRVCDCAGL